MRDLIIIVSIMFTKKAMAMAINSLLHRRYNCQVKHHCSNNFVPHLENDIVETEMHSMVVSIILVRTCELQKMSGICCV